MSIGNVANAAAAYAVRQVTSGKPNQAAEPAASTQGNFAQLVKSAVGDAVSSSQQSEAVSLQALVDPGDIGSVVTAVTNAEVTLQTVVAVRDKVVQAYQDILRMPI